MRKFLYRGLGAMLPLGLTALFFYLTIDALWSYVGVPIGNLIRWVAGSISADLLVYLEERGDWAFPAAGFLIGFFLLVLIGFLVATFLGKKLVQLLEWLVEHLPIIRVIYPYAKQFTEFLFSAEDRKKMEFKSPVAVPFPTHGVYSIGFVTSEGLQHLDNVTEKHHVCVFVPTSPTPFTGFIIYVSREDIIPLPISVDEAMRLFISAGVLAPTHQMVQSAKNQAGEHRPLPETAEMD